jgi:hypothetical protein
MRKAKGIISVIFIALLSIVQAMAGTGVDACDILTSFTARLDNSNTIIEWDTMPTDKCVCFDIQKSEDGINFTSIKHVTASNATLSESHYILIDNTLPLNGVAYYRILEVQKNGAFTYSAMRTVGTPSFSTALLK